MLDYLDTDRLPDEVPARPARRPCVGRRGAVAVAATTAGASRLVPRSPPTRCEAGRRAAGPPRRTDRTAEDVAVRPGDPRHRPQGQDRRAAPMRAVWSPGSPTSATGRRCGPSSGPDAVDGPVPDAARARRAHPPRRLASRGRRDRGRRVAHPARPSPTTWPRGCRAASRCPSWAAGRSSTRTSPLAAARPTRPSGSPRSAVGPTSRPTSPPTSRVLLVDDLVVTGWTLTLAARAIRGAGAAAVLPLTLAVQS